MHPEPPALILNTPLSLDINLYNTAIFGACNVNVIAESKVSSPPDVSTSYCSVINHRTFLKDGATVVRPIVGPTHFSVIA